MSEYLEKIEYEQKSSFFIWVTLHLPCNLQDGVYTKKS